MTEGVIGAKVWRSPDMASTTAGDTVYPETESLCPPRGWDPESFAREQIRGLVRQVFFSSASRPVRQVVFSAIEAESDMTSLCRQVGEALAQQTQETVAVVGGYPRLLQGTGAQPEESGGRTITDGGTPLRQIAARVHGNLWLVPDRANGGSSAGTSLHSYLSEVRRQFAYSIVHAPSAGESDEAIAMAQFADGIILALSARRTRRAAACKIKAALEAAQAHLLGAVLCDRVFPIPEAIYRRL